MMLVKLVFASKALLLMLIGVPYYMVRVSELNSYIISYNLYATFDMVTSGGQPTMVTF